MSRSEFLRFLISMYHRDVCRLENDEEKGLYSVLDEIIENQQEEAD